MTVVSVTLSSHLISLPSFNLPSCRGGSPTDGSFYLQCPEEPYLFLLQGDGTSSSKTKVILALAPDNHPPFLNTFPTVGVICIIKVEGRPYTASGEQHSSTRVLIPKNCRNIPESQTWQILTFFQICHTFQLEKPRFSAQIVPEVCVSYISFLQGSKDYYNIQITERGKLIGLINIQVNDDTVNTFH